LVLAITPEFDFAFLIHSPPLPKGAPIVIISGKQPSRLSSQASAALNSSHLKLTSEPKMYGNRM
jgi:hypothetical protein